MSNNETQLLSFVGESARPYKSMTVEEASSYMDELRSVEEGSYFLLGNHLRCIKEEAEYELDSIQENFRSFINESADMNDTTENKLMAIEDKKSSMVKSFRDHIFDNQNSIKRISAKANDEAINMIAIDRKTFKVFLSALRDRKNLEGFIGIKDFVFPGEKYSDCAETIINSTDTVVNLHKKYMNYLLQANSLEALKKYYKAYDDEMMAEIEDKIDLKLNTDLKVKAPRWLPTIKDLSYMIRFINNPSMITCSIADGCRHAVGNLSKVTSNGETFFRRINGESDLDVIRLNYMYRCTSLANRKIGSIFFQFKDITIRQIAAYRKSIMIAGKYANDKKNKKIHSVKEWAMLEDAMSTVSDIYIFDKLSGPTYSNNMNHIIETHTQYMNESINIITESIVNYFTEESEGTEASVDYFAQLKDSLDKAESKSKDFYEEAITRFENEISENKEKYDINLSMVRNVKDNHIFGTVHSFDKLDTVKPSENCVIVIKQIAIVMERFNSDHNAGARACEMIIRDIPKVISGMESTDMSNIDDRYKDFLAGDIIKIDKNWLEMNTDTLRNVVTGNEIINILKDMQKFEEMIYTSGKEAIDNSMDHEDISNTMNISHYSLIMNCLNVMHMCNAAIIDVYHRKMAEYKNIVSRLNNHYNESSDLTEPVEEISMNDLKQKISNMGDKVSQIGSSFDALKTKAADAAHKIIDATVGNANSSSNNNSVASKAIDFVKNAKDKVQNFVGNVKDKVADKVGDFKDFMSDRFDIKN